MSWMLPRLVGLTRANDLLLSGRVVTAGGDRVVGPVERRRSPTARPRSAAATDYGRLLATTAGPNAVAMTKRQIADDLLRHDPAASINDSLRLLDRVDGHAPNTARASPRCVSGEAPAGEHVLTPARTPLLSRAQAAR